MSFYPEPEESDEGSSISESDEDYTEEDGMLRSYHVGGLPSLGLVLPEPTALATIAEDAEEDSGDGESSSGHWLFSADSTDTDSVIQVPLPLALTSSLPVQYEDDGDQSSSEETLVTSEDDEARDGWKSFSERRDRLQEGSVYGFQWELRRGSPMTSHTFSTFKGKSYSPATSHDRGTTKLPIELPTLSSFSPHEDSTNMFEDNFAFPSKNPMDDIFDFSSLDESDKVSFDLDEEDKGAGKNCEDELSMEFAGEDDQVVFNTSATSKPFEITKVVHSPSPLDGEARRNSVEEENKLDPTSGAEDNFSKEAFFAQTTENQTSSVRSRPRRVPRNNNLLTFVNGGPFGWANSDGDTDDTDGDFEEARGTQFNSSPSPTSSLGGRTEDGSSISDEPHTNPSFNGTSPSVPTAFESREECLARVRNSAHISVSAVSGSDVYKNSRQEEIVTDEDRDGRHPSVIGTGIYFSDSENETEPGMSRQPSSFTQLPAVSSGADLDPQTQVSDRLTARRLCPRGSRPKPLSVDMAEEFISQHGLASRDQEGFVSGGVASYNNFVNTLPNRNILAVTSTSSFEARHYEATLASKPDMNNGENWLNARNQPPLQPSPAAVPRYSCEPSPTRQLASTFREVEVCQLACHSARENSLSARHFISIDSREKCPDFTPVRSCKADLSTFQPANMSERVSICPVRTKAYGPHCEVEVYLAKGDSTGQSPSAPFQEATETQKPRGVTFSPSVKEVLWRESYLKADEGDYDYTQMEEKEVKRVKVKSSESPTLQKVGPKTTSNGCGTYQAKNMTPYQQPQVASNQVQCDNYYDNYNDPSFQSPSDNASSPPRPIWQRLKLVKVGPRPQIPPKPPSLSSRSSSSPSSPESEDSSVHKRPSSPRFFSWGSKKEKTPRQSSPMTSWQVEDVAPFIRGESTQLGSVDAASSTNASTPVSREMPIKEMNGYDFFATRNFILKNAKKSNQNLVNNENYNKIVTSKEETRSSSPANWQSSPSSGIDSPPSSSSTAKPPLPPTVHSRGTSQIHSRNKVLHSRRQYLSHENEANSTQNPFSVPLQEGRSATLPASVDSSSYPFGRTKSAAERLKERFERFSKTVREERERLARSTPDLAQMEESLRRHTPRIDSGVDGKLVHTITTSPHSVGDGNAAGLPSASQGPPLTRGEVRSFKSSSLRGTSYAPSSAFNRVSAEFERLSQRGRARSIGVLETDIDTGDSREVYTPQETNLDDLYQDLQNFLESLSSQGSAAIPAERTKAKSLLQLDATSTRPKAMDSNMKSSRVEDSRARSMEFLLDDENRAAVQAPENELMKEGERKLSEAELRVRRSLQRLDVPEWMKTANTQQGFLLRRRDYNTPTGGWSGFSSKTGSMTSLGSSRATTPSRVVIPTRISTRAYGGLTSPASTTSMSPTSTDKGFSYQYPLSRWSTSRINSGSTTPIGSYSSQRASSFARQPYLGWRSNASLSSLGGSQSSLTGHSTYLSPAERLALSLQRPQTKVGYDGSILVHPKVNSRDELESDIQKKLERVRVADVHSSIKEVTSAIVHYCKETSSPKESPKSSPNLVPRGSSPRRLVWLESSFVGTKPINSPETPTEPLSPSAVNGHKEDLVDSRPPQSAEVFLNNFRRFIAKELHGTNKDTSGIKMEDSSTANITVDSASSNNIITVDGSRENQMPVISEKPAAVECSNSLSEMGSKKSTADTIDSVISSRDIESLNNRNSSSSRDSSSSRCSSSATDRSSSGEELPVYLGSAEDIPIVQIEAFRTPTESANLFSVTDNSALMASGQSSFSTFRAEDDSSERSTETEPVSKGNTFHPEDTLPTSNAKKFSEGENPQTKVISYEDQSEIFNSSRRVGSESQSYGFSFPSVAKEPFFNSQDERSKKSSKVEQGYGFNFSSFSNKESFFEVDTLQEVEVESTALEDVLDSLLAIPSTSRSPSPVMGSPRISSERSYTTSSFLSAEPGKKFEDSTIGYLRNHNFGSDSKIESYRKSLTYATSPNAAESTSEKSKKIDNIPVTFSLGHGTANAKISPNNNTLRSAKDQEPFQLNNNNSLTMTTSHEHPDTSLAFSQSHFSQYQIRETDWGDTLNISSQPRIKFPSKISSGRRASMESGLPERKSVLPSSILSSGHKLHEMIAKEPKVTFHLPPKHMNIPPDSSSENGNGSDILPVDDDDAEEVTTTSEVVEVVVHCRNNMCKNSATVEEAKTSYKTCHNCSVFYCSRSCRRTHWEKHKKVCEKVKATTVADQVVDRIKTDREALKFVSVVARRGTLALGRGAVKIFFPNTASADDFVKEGKLPEAHYQALHNIMPQEMGSQVYKNIIEFGRSYNPEIKFILYVSICTFSETPSATSPKCRRETVAQCAKLRLSEQETKVSRPSETIKPSPPERHVITRELNEPETLLLAASGEYSEVMPPRQERETVFSNIIRELQERGVELKTQHAEIYRKLSHYVDFGGHFSPVTIYPRDSRKGHSFMCIIMPEVDPQKTERVGSSSSNVLTVDVSRPNPAIT